MLRWAVRRGVAPFAPHLLYPGALNDDDAVERLQGILAGVAFLRACDELWYLDGPKGITAGMTQELAVARIEGLVVRPVRTDLLGDFVLGDPE